MPDNAYKYSYLIVGASSDIAIELIQLYQTQEHNLTLIVRDDTAKKQLSKSIPGAYIIVLDLGDIKAVETCLGAHNTRYDACIYFAGVGYYKTPDKLTLKEISDQYIINTITPSLFVSHFSQTSKFVYISSIMRHLSPKNIKIYAESKAIMTKTLKYYGKNTLNIDLGAVKTKMHIRSGYGKPSGKNIQDIIPKLQKAIDAKTGTITLFLDWWIYSYIVFPVFRIFMK